MLLDEFIQLAEFHVPCPGHYTGARWNIGNLESDTLTEWVSKLS